MSNTTNFKFNIIDFDKIPWHTDEHNNWHLADALLARYLNVSNVQGVWQNAVAVTVSQRYIDSATDTIWEVLIAHTTPSTGTFAASRTAVPENWQSVTIEVTAKGQWLTATSYNPNDFVFDASRYGVVQNTYTSGATYNADVTAGNIATLVDVSSDVAATAADVVSTNADVVSTNADLVLTNADVVLTNADVLSINGAVVSTNADVVSTNADVVLTNADVVLTNADAAATAADLIATNQDTIDTAADLVATNQDTIDTAADLVATNQDTIDTAADLVLTNADVLSTNADVVLTNADVVSTNADVVSTNADVITTNADAATTTQDAIDTAADAVSTAADVVSTAADVVSTGNDVTSTNADVTAAAASATAAAASGGVLMAWETTTTDTDQGVGKVWTNHATPASATVLYMDDVEDASASINSWVDSWDDSTHAISGTVTIYTNTDPAIFAIYDVTGAVTSATTYSKIAVTYITGAGTFVDAAPVSVMFVRSGDDGAGVGDLLATNNLSDVASAPTALANIGGVSLGLTIALG